MAPPTAFADLGFGPLLSLDLAYVVLSLQPRVAIAALFRSEVEDPFVNWVFGAVGMNFAVGVRPINRLSFQAQYSPMVFDVALQGGGEPAPAIMHRLVGTLELGF